MDIWIIENNDGEIHGAYWTLRDALSGLEEINKCRIGSIIKRIRVVGNFSMKMMYDSYRVNNNKTEA